MILLDTNVVSEAMKPEPNSSVRDSLDAQAAETLFLSSVTIAELMSSIGLPARSRRAPVDQAAGRRTIRACPDHRRPPCAAAIYSPSPPARSPRRR
jgi:predicted nucleic acid-binding protein